MDAAAIAERIERDVLAFQTSGTGDDLAVLVLRVRDQSDGRAAIEAEHALTARRPAE
jgi:hypothetical protein